MEAKDQAERAMMNANTDAVGQVAVIGVVAICNELARLGALDGAAVGRIRAFMTLSAERSGATQQLRAHLARTIDRHFEELLDAMQQAPDVGPASH